VKTLADVMNDLTAIESSVQCLLDAGEIEPTDARLFTIDLARRSVQSIDAQRDAKRSELRVRQLIGITPDAAVMLVPAGEEALGPRPVADPESHPRLLVARADYAAAERVLDLAVRRQFPDIEVGGGLGSEEGDTRLLGGVSVPIPILNGNRREIAEARARRDAVRAAYEAALLSLIADRTAAAAEIEATQASLDAMQATVVPLVDHQIKAARHLLDAGEFNPLVVRDAIAAAADVRMEMNAAKRAVALAKIEQCLLTETASQTPQVKP
jgi:outer membrane protein, heavy metal efflux system